MTNLEFSEITNKTDIREKHGVTQDVRVREATQEETAKVNQILAKNGQDSNPYKLFIGVGLLDDSFDTGKVFAEIAPQNKLMFLNVTL